MQHFCAVIYTVILRRALGLAGASTLQSSASKTGDIVNTVVVDDLLFGPEETRPMIRIGPYGSASSTLVRLQAHHVFLVKVDIEGYDVAAAYGMRKARTKCVHIALLFHTTTPHAHSGWRHGDSQA